MVFKNTSCAKRRSGGFTLAEFMVATFVGLLVMTAALVLWAFSTRTCAMLLHYVELSNSSKVALDLMSQQIRNATAVQSCSANELVLLVPGTSNTVQTVTFSYNPTAKTLTRTITGGASTSAQVKTLLKECGTFQFAIFQRTPQANSFSLYNNAFSITTAKVVQMRWNCSRKLTGDKNVLENQMSANVVIRNK